MPDIVQSVLWSVQKYVRMFLNEKLEQGWDMVLDCFEIVKDGGER